VAPYLTQHLLVQGGTSTPDVSLPPGTRRNADTLRKALLDPDTLAVRPEDCRTIVPESPHDVFAQLSEASSSDGPLIVYWTGHGRLTDGGALQLALTHDRLDDDPPRWIGARELVTAMRRSGGPARDRLLLLDTCLSGGRGSDEVPYSTAAIQREMEYLGRSGGVAVLSSVGPSPAAFAANHHAPSVFTQQLTELLRSPRWTGQGLDLTRLYELLYASLKGSGYLPPLLCNASGFRLPLTRTGLRPPAASHGLAVRRPSEVAVVLSRYALTVAGALEAAWAESDAGPDYDPGRDAAWVHRRLLNSFCGFTPASASLLRTAPSRDELLNRVAEMALEGRNLLLVYVTAHATARTADGGRLDLHLRLADDETVSVADLVERLRQARAEQVVVLVDACHAGRDAGAGWQMVSEGGRRPFHALRPGFSRLVVQWFNARQGESVHLPAHGVGAFADEMLPGHDTDDPKPGVTRWSTYAAWAFAFRGATITYDDSQGPLEDWLEFLRLGSDSERRRRAPLTSLADSLFDAAARAVPEQEPTPEPTQEHDDADKDAEPSEGGRRGGGSFRRHRARLRVTDDVLPARVGRTLQVVFDYTPMDEAWTPRPGVDATQTAPLNITLRIRADSAMVRPAVIHTSLTDADGTPAERFEVTPQGEGPVRLRISVLRSADGTVIQQVSSVLPVADEDGAVVSS
jgi:hypothetical protein